VGNVWIRILPNQSKMIACTKAGKPVDQSLGINAKNRSTHNHYFTLPMIFIMMSNHFPSTYGHRWNWVFLILVGLVGATLRYAFNCLEKSKPKAFFYVIAAFVGFIFLFLMTLPAQNTEEVHIPSSHPHNHSQTSTTPTPEKKEDPPVLKKIDLTQVGQIKGIIQFQGEVPVQEVLTALPTSCMHHHQGKTPQKESVLAQNGRLQNVMVRVIEGLELFELDTPPSLEPKGIDQLGCVYLPHILMVQTDQKVYFTNSDEELHNVNGFILGQQIFNFAILPQGKKVTKRFKEPGIVELRCDVHPWMVAYIGVHNHPYYALSNDHGEFQIAGLPPGNYTLEAWHEVYGRQTQKVTLLPQGQMEISFTFVAQK
jgi:plastocyanin